MCQLGDPALLLVVITTEVGNLFPLVCELMTDLMVKYVRHLVPAWPAPGAWRCSAWWLVALHPGVAELAVVGARR